MSDTTYGETVWDPAVYDESRHRLIPGLDLLYGGVADAVRMFAGPAPRVLELGAGTGLLTSFVLARVPDARIELLDGSPAMLAQARIRLGEDITTFVADLNDPLPDGPYDAIVSAMAIHHLSDEAKRAVFTGAFERLRPGGLFVNLEQLLAPTEAMQTAYDAWNEASARAAGTDHAEWHAALDRMRVDQCATLADQLAWLAQAGFADVDVLVKNWRFGAYCGRVPARD